MRSFLASAGLLALSSLLACSAAPNDGVGSDEAHETQGARTLGVIKGRELARCWFDRVGDDQQLSCTSTAKGSDPLNLQVRVSVSGSSGVSQSLDVTAGGTVVLGKLPASSFPRDVELQAYMSLDDSTMLGADAQDWAARGSNVDASTITKDKPLVLSEPFDFWEVGTVYAITQGGGYSFTAHEYKRDMNPYSVGLEGKKEIAFTPETAGLPGKTKVIVAPKDAGPLAVTWSHDGKKIETSIAGPGYYAYTDDGIRAATPEEITRNYGAAPAPAPQPQPEPQPEPQPVTPPTPTWTDPDPTCGGDNQLRCAADQSCDPGTRFDGFQRCMACGGNDKPYCFVDPKGVDASQGKKCDPGTRWDGYQHCMTCGADQQPYCYADPNGGDPSTGKKCNPGTRWDGYQHCMTCGGDQQPYCYADPNGGDPNTGKKCNPGTRWDGYQHCMACGGESQPYCYADANGADPSTAKTCNDGLRLAGNTCIK